MSKLHVENKQIVVPGEVLAEGMEYLPSNGTYRQGENILANRVGLLRIDGKVLKSIPLSGIYMPKPDDVIIGRVMDILISGWRMDLFGPYPAVMGLQAASFDFIDKGADLSKFFALDDYAVVKITNVHTQKLVDVTAKGPGLHKLRGGRIMHVNTNKVPRLSL